MTQKCVAGTCGCCPDEPKTAQAKPLTAYQRFGPGGCGLNAIRDEALRIAVEHGFKDATVGEDLMLMVSELAEALEDHRHGNGAAEVWYETPDGKCVSRSTDLDRLLYKPCGIPSEMADVLIRVFHFCGKHGIDIEKAVSEKMAYNEARPFKHGGKTL